MSLDHWANQFVAKGFKIARVVQSESALGKEMREREGKKPTKEDKIIKRELACVLTAGTLVEGSMLQDDMSTYCVAIKEAIVDESLRDKCLEFSHVNIVHELRQEELTSSSVDKCDTELCFAEGHAYSQK
jgi:DNA mismatch repair ATPase MutS